MTSVDLSKIKHNRKLIETLMNERDYVASSEVMRLQLQVAYLERHPFKNLWAWIMGQRGSNPW